MHERARARSWAIPVRSPSLESDERTGLRGRVHARGTGPLRIAIAGEGVVREALVVDGRWRIDGLCAGTYRVELIGTRMVISRRVEIAHGERGLVDFVVW